MLAQPTLAPLAPRFVEPVAGPVAQPTAAKPPQFNFAGFCMMCGQQGCRSIECTEAHLRTLWGVCTDCGGTGYDPDQLGHCRWCWGGVVEYVADESGAVA